MPSRRKSSALIDRASRRETGRLVVCMKTHGDTIKLPGTLDPIVCWYRSESEMVRCTLAKAWGMVKIQSDERQSAAKL